MSDSITITLAGQSYAIAPLTLGQIEDLSVAVAIPATNDPEEDVRRSFRRSIGIVAAGLSASHPEITAVSLRTMVVSRAELTSAVEAILDLSGLVPRKESAPGEREAAAA